MKIKLHLSSELFHALLEGKELQYQTPDYHVIIYPPHYGLYLTHAQMAEIKDRAYADGAVGLIQFLEKLSEVNRSHGRKERG